MCELVQEVEVFGLLHPIHWPRGTRVEVVGRGDGDTLEVIGPGGKRVTLPRRLVKVSHKHKEQPCPQR